MKHDTAVLLLVLALILAPFLIALVIRFSSEIDAFFTDHQLALGWTCVLSWLYGCIRGGRNITYWGKIV